MTDMVNRIAIHVLTCYKKYISPLLGAHCRFTPTCSSYAITAMEKYPFHKASWLVLKRLLKCHPFHPGGHDPL